MQCKRLRWVLHGRSFWSVTSTCLWKVTFHHRIFYWLLSWRHWWKWGPSGVVRKEFQKTHKEGDLVIRFICGTRCKIRGIPLSFKCPISVCPTLRKSILTFNRPRNKASVQTFCAMPRLVQSILLHHPASLSYFTTCISVGAHSGSLQASRTPGRC